MPLNFNVGLCWWQLFFPKGHPQSGRPSTNTSRINIEIGGAKGGNRKRPGRDWEHGGALGPPILMKSVREFLPSTVRQDVWSRCQGHHSTSSANQKSQTSKTRPRPPCKRTKTQTKVQGEADKSSKQIRTGCAGRAKHQTQRTKREEQRAQAHLDRKHFC